MDLTIRKGLVRGLRDSRHFITRLGRSNRSTPPTMTRDGRLDNEVTRQAFPGEYRTRSIGESSHKECFLPSSHRQRGRHYYFLEYPRSGVLFCLRHVESFQ
jgi:hypothetical protein